MGFFNNLFKKENLNEEKSKKFTEIEKEFSGEEEMIKNTKATWLTSMANYYGGKKMFGEAEAIFKEAIEFKKDFLPAYFGLAVVYKEQGDFQKGLKVIKEAPEEMRLFGKITAKKDDLMKEMMQTK